jgi:hypothetical protein
MHEMRIRLIGRFGVTQTHISLDACFKMGDLMTSTPTLENSTSLLDEEFTFSDSYLDGVAILEDNSGTPIDFGHATRSYL